MTSYQKDAKWQKAKQLLSQGYTWIEVVSYYKILGGANVKVYSVMDKEKFLILDVTEAKNVILEDTNGETIFADYADVQKSRKVFEYT